MLFRRIIISALIVGICSGLFLTLLQNMRLLQIIIEAEQYENSTSSVQLPSAAQADEAQHVHAADITHEHAEAAWKPANESERFRYTMLSNILAGIGFAAILVSLMSMSGKQVTIRAGLLWGLSGFTVFFMSPSLGLPPELPGMQSAELGQRQTWWLMAVMTAAAGLACIAFAEKYYKFLGGLLLLLPHLIGAPQPASATRFVHSHAEAVTNLESLHSQFIQLVAAANFFYWVVLGLLSAFLVRKYVKPNGLLSNKSI